FVKKKIQSPATAPVAAGQVLAPHSLGGPCRLNGAVATAADGDVAGFVSFEAGSALSDGAQGISGLGNADLGRKTRKLLLEVAGIRVHVSDPVFCMRVGTADILAGYLVNAPGDELSAVPWTDPVGIFFGNGRTED